MFGFVWNTAKPSLSVLWGIMSGLMNKKDPVGFRSLVALSFPIAISLLSYTAMGIVDTIFVSDLGTSELAAVGLAVTIVFFLHAFTNGLLNGVRVAVSQKIGFGDEQSAKEFAFQGIWLAGFFSSVVLLIAYYIVCH